AVGNLHRMVAAMSACKSSAPRTERQQAVNGDRRKCVLRKDRGKTELRRIAFVKARMLEDQILAHCAGAKFVDQRMRKDVRLADDEVMVVALVVASVGIGVAIVPGAVHARIACDGVPAEDFVFFAEVVIYADAGLRLVNREADQSQ